MLSFVPFCATYKHQIQLARNATLCFSELPSQTPPTDVQQSLNSVGLFDLIDMMDCNLTTPTLTQLMQYDSVMVWSRNFFANATLLGDVLADYVDLGRTVVAAWYSFRNEYGIGGRLNDSNYLPFVSSILERNGVRYQLVAVNRTHPLLFAVNSFDGNNNRVSLFF